MILVDTSVLTSYLKGQAGTKIELFDKVLSRKIPFGISAYTYQDILHSARDEKEMEKLREYLSSQTIYFLPEVLSTYEKAAQLAYTLRQRGIATRNSIDVLVALTAIENDLLLLHDERNFDLIALWTPELKIMSSI